MPPEAGQSPNTGDTGGRRHLNKHPRTGIEIFPELLWRTGLLLLKDAVEIGDIVEPAMVGDLGDRMRRIDQHPARMPKPDLIQTIDKGIPCPFFHKPAERHLRHAHQTGHLAKCYRLVVIGIHVLKGLLDTPAVIGKMLIGK